ncbi:MAG: response regulator transcription factor [Bacteroidia bacterium]|nr:response regulator transcription factor [Bacteroidia bacterium]
MNCLIVDDNKLARTVLKHLISGLDFLSLAADCENILEATNIINNQKIDLMLLDVEMPKISGLDFLKTMPNHPLVILISAKAEYAVQAFEYNVVDFLVKPVKEDRFLKAIYRAKEIYESKNRLLEVNKEFFFIREKGISTKLVINDILYLQALGDYVNIHTASKRYTIHYTLSAIEKELPPSKFMRIHRSYLVALDKIEAVEEGTAFIYQLPLPVGDNQRAELMKRLNLL